MLYPSAEAPPETTRTQATIEVATAALEAGLATIEQVHTAIARKPFAVLRLAPGVGEVSEVVRVVHDGITSLVYGSLRTAIVVAGGAARLAARCVPADTAERPRGSTAELAEMAVAALNGWAGERLEHHGNPLATKMGVRHRGRSVAPERTALAAAFPDATPRVAVFVHGLASSETMWNLHAERHYGDRHTNYGSRLQADLGYTPLYVRYNSGLHISDNGRQLAQLLDRVVSAWPVPIDELLIVGHSMGGLVARSGCHYGQEAGLGWVDRVRHVVFLGSPHLGAPLEKVTNAATWLLGLTDVTRPFADALNTRSVGIKDLRFGAVLDDHWRDADLDALLENRTSHVPLLPGANHYFVAATLTRSPRHPVAVAIGDLLVREASAFGRGRVRQLQFPIEHGRHVGAMHHLALLNHPDLYEQMRRWIAPSTD